ncbi:unnamed protein product [Schistosoma bovis]|nr:unnamed protein product [Schistosoma bovis]
MKEFGKYTFSINSLFVTMYVYAYILPLVTQYTNSINGELEGTPLPCLTSGCNCCTVLLIAISWYPSCISP